MGSIWAIDIKRSMTPKIKKGFYIACDDLKPSRRFVIYAGNEHYPIANDVEVIGLFSFLNLLRKLHQK